eukprot:GHVN01053060.1.p1 GENE.GHVN01053060.1~~GHVN01053060.1.p1  ORF type:complete len:742 (-),score=119.72 GHVN01053060.1:212-2395(-)
MAKVMLACVFTVVLLNALDTHAQRPQGDTHRHQPPPTDRAHPPHPEILEHRDVRRPHHPPHHDTAPDAHVDVSKANAVAASCPDGYYLHSGQCVAKSEVPPKHDCPKGTTEHLGRCLEYRAARHVCPVTLRLQGTECVGHTSINKTHRCPKGSVMRGTDCVIHISQVPTCPTGTAAFDDKCARMVPVVKDCPPGYLPRGDLCGMEELSAPVVTCPQGTFPNNGACHIETKTLEECPKGTVDVGDRCATYTSKLRECPKGYSLKGETCIHTEIAPKEEVCPNGADPQHHCLVKVPVVETPYCTHGKLIKGKCFKPRRVSPYFKCPVGFDKQHGDQCVKVERFDCSETHHDVECVAEQKGKQGYHHRRLLSNGVGGYYNTVRLLGVDSKGKYQQVNNYSKKTPPLVPVCHKVPSTVRKICEKTSATKALPFCKEGVFDAHSSHCVVEEWFEAQSKCDAISDGKGTCYAEEVTPVIRVCPDGYSNIGHACSRTHTASATYYCPPATQPPTCATFVNKVCRGGSCHSIHEEPPQVFCPDGYRMLGSPNSPSPLPANSLMPSLSTSLAQLTQHPKMMELSHNSPNLSATLSTPQSYLMPYIPTLPSSVKCVKTIYADKVKRCPKGTQPTEGLKCASYVDPVRSERDILVALQAVCDEGYAEQLDKCVKRIVSPPVVECGEGWEITEGSTCAREVSQVVRCPEGAVFEKGKCWAVSLLEPVMVDTVVPARGKM